MTPNTVHLLAQLVRHARGMLTAVEKWLQSQGDGDSQSGLKE